MTTLFTNHTAAFAILNPTKGCNWQIYDYLCTLETCCLEQSSFLYLPVFGGNLFFAIFFGILLVFQVGLGVWYKTWGFMVGMIFGLVLEVIGYVGRVQLHNNPFDGNAFLLYLITLTIGPVFLSGAIYLCLTRILVLYGAHLSRLKPRTLAIAFMTSDFLSLVLQAIGGAIADTATDPTINRAGVNTMIAGLFLQAVSLATFIVVCADFGLRCRRGRLSTRLDQLEVRNRRVSKLFLVGLLAATLAILIRSIFRVAELWGGFSGKLWNNETDFLVLDGAMIGFASLCLTALHPGRAFGGEWAAANWKLRSAKKTQDADYSLARDGESKEASSRILQSA